MISGYGVAMALLCRVDQMSRDYVDNNRDLDPLSYGDELHLCKK